MHPKQYATSAPPANNKKKPKHRMAPAFASIQLAIAAE
jgi:hypothetical protein